MVARELLVRKPLFRNPSRGHSTSSSDPTDYLDRLHNLYNPTSCASYASTLRLCGNEKALLDGRRAHSLIITRGLEQNKLLANLLVHMYGSCGVLQDACFHFARLRKRDPFSWNFMMTAFTRQGCFKEALELFDDMQLEGVKPDKFIFASILSACAEKSALATGKHIHILIMTHELGLDVVLANAVVNMYAKCGHLEDAKAMFHGIHHKIDASWNAIISGFAQDGQGQDVIILFNQMMMEGALPNKVTFIGVVSACANKEYLIQGKQMHARLAAIEYESDVVLANTLINMYGKCGNLKKSRELFDNLPQRSTVSWNAMITSYAQHGQGWKAYELFTHLHQEGALANRVTFRSLLPGFDHTASKECKRLHIRIMSSNLGPDIDMISSLVNMYCKCGNFRDALEVFELMPEHDLLAWNALISGYSQHALDKPALWHFHQMLQEGVLPDKTTFLSILLGCANQAVLAEGNQIHALLAGSKIESDVVIGSALLNMYGKCGSVQDACTMFYGMPERNEYSWTAMIAAYAEHGQARDAMLLFERMQWEGINLDRVAILCMLCACSNQAALTHGKHAHTYVLGTGFETDVTVGNALVTMYSKCGSLENARKVFNRMPEQNLISWTAVIAACAQHGQGKDAIRFFERMQKEGEDPDKVTYAEILSACSHAGLVDEACHALASMKQWHGIKPTVDHYNCLIDLLTRTGRLDVAEHVILNMPLRPTAVSWLTLLGACRSQLDLERGERAAKWACDLCLEDPAPFVTLSNLYAGSGRFDDAAWVINQMWIRGQEQHLGSCSLQVHGARAIQVTTSLAINMTCSGAL